MVKIILALSLILASTNVYAEPILNKYTGVIFNSVRDEIVDSTLHRILPVEISNFQTVSPIDSIFIDLDQFGFPEQSSMLTIFLTDWLRDRVLFADIHQTIVPDYFILDFRTRTIYRPESDILNQILGDLYFTPECRYIVHFGNIDSTGQNYLENHSLIYTLVIDPETFNLISRKEAFSAITGTYPPNYFFSGDTAIYINNPFAGPRNRQLISLSLPYLSIQDTIKLAQFCDRTNQWSFTWDIKANSALIYSELARNDSLLSSYKIIDLISNLVIAEKNIPKAIAYGSARLSDDGLFAVFQRAQHYDIFGRNLNYLFTIENVPEFSLPGAVFNNGLMNCYSDSAHAVLEYDLSTGMQREH